MVKVAIKVMPEKNMEKSLEATQQDLFSSVPFMKFLFSSENIFPFKTSSALMSRAICQMRDFHSRISLSSHNLSELISNFFNYVFESRFAKNNFSSVA